MTQSAVTHAPGSRSSRRDGPKIAQGKRSAALGKWTEEESPPRRGGAKPFATLHSQFTRLLPRVLWRSLGAV